MWADIRAGFWPFMGCVLFMFIVAGASFLIANFPVLLLPVGGAGVLFFMWLFGRSQRDGGSDV